MSKISDLPNELDADIWVQLSRSHMAVQTRIEQALKAANLPPLAWYDILLELERLGPDGGRAFVVQTKLLLPQYGLSRLLDRLENAGYLARESCVEDGRGKRLIITKQGKKVRHKMWLVYRATLKREVGEKLSEADGQRLIALLKRLI